MHLFAYLQAQRKQYKVHEAKASEASNNVYNSWGSDGAVSPLEKYFSLFTRLHWFKM